MIHIVTQISIQGLCLLSLCKKSAVIVQHKEVALNNVLPNYLN